MAILTRFMFIPNAGFGNPNQYPIIGSTPITPPGLYIPRANYDLFAINAEGKGENFVIFARPNARFTDEIPGINDGDVLNIFEFIYETLLKRCFSADKRSCDLKIELDVSRCPGMIDMIHLLPQIMPSHLDIAVTPMARAFFNEMNLSYQMNGSVKNLGLHYVNYDAEKCREYFFPSCEDKCCKQNCKPPVNDQDSPNLSQLRELNIPDSYLSSMATVSKVREIQKKLWSDIISNAIELPVQFDDFDQYKRDIEAVTRPWLDKNHFDDFKVTVTDYSPATGNLTLRVIRRFHTVRMTWIDDLDPDDKEVKTKANRDSRTSDDILQEYLKVVTMEIEKETPERDKMISTSYGIHQELRIEPLRSAKHRNI